MNYLHNKAVLEYEFATGSGVAEDTATSNMVNTPLCPNNTTLFVQKIAANSFFKPCEPITYSIVITNSGNECVENIAVLEPLCDQEYIKNSARLTINGCPAQPCVLKVGKIIFDGCKEKKFGFMFGDLAPRSTAVITFKTKPNPCACQICNQVVVFYGDGQGSNQNRKSKKSNVVCLPKAYAQIVAEKVASKQTVSCGDQLTYTICLTNLGNSAAINGTLTDCLPEGFRLHKNGVKVNGCHHNYCLEGRKLTICGLSIPAKNHDCGCNQQEQNRVIITLSGCINCADIDNSCSCNQADDQGCGYQEANNCGNDGNGCQNRNNGCGGFGSFLLPLYNCNNGQRKNKQGWGCNCNQGSASWGKNHEDREDCED